MSDSSLSGDNLSFYHDAQSFEAFHKYTSYYNHLQKALVTLTQAKPGSHIVDLGCAVGDTTRALAAHYPDCKVIGIDFRPEIIAVAENESPKSLYPNLSFKAADMGNPDAYLPKVNEGEDWIFTTLYSFHHIPDPIQNKERFLETLMALPCRSVKIVVGDETTPVPFGEETYQEATLKQWQSVAQEGYRSVFLNRYMELVSQGLPTDEAREAAILAGEYVKEVELEIGRWTADRKDEYPLSPTEMSNLFLEAGFHLDLFTHANPLGDVILVACR
jgi:SAM-dependent methyltransferase